MTRPVAEFQNVGKTYHVGLLQRRRSTPSAT